MRFFRVILSCVACVLLLAMPKHPAHVVAAREACGEAERLLRATAAAAAAKAAVPVGPAAAAVASQAEGGAGAGGGGAAAPTPVGQAASPSPPVASASEATLLSELAKVIAKMGTCVPLWISK